MNFNLQVLCTFFIFSFSGVGSIIQIDIGTSSLLISFVVLGLLSVSYWRHRSVIATSVEAGIVILSQASMLLLLYTYESFGYDPYFLVICELIFSLSIVLGMYIALPIRMKELWR